MRRPDRRPGIASLELVLALPLLVFLAAMILAIGRVGVTRTGDDAVHDGGDVGIRARRGRSGEQRQAGHREDRHATAGAGHRFAMGIREPNSIAPGAAPGAWYESASWPSQKPTPFTAASCFWNQASTTSAGWRR